MTPKPPSSPETCDMDQLVRRLAKETETEPAKAADQIDGMIHKILKQLREGKPVRIPGLGKFSPGQTTSFQPEEANATSKRPRRDSRPAR